MDYRSGGKTKLPETIGTVLTDSIKPAVAILHTIYAVYHLCRPAAGRPPGSTTSYMLFASSADAALVPFYAFTAFMAYGEYTENTHNWGTLFDNQKATYDITYATFLISTTCAGLHLVSFIISIYLAVVFRQISRLPPDMNPLEDNLTARPHKRNKSEISEKHLSRSTIDSASVSHEHDINDPTQVRSIPFMHTRQGSSDQLSNQESVGEKRASRTSIHSNRMSRSDLPSQQQRLYEQSSHSSVSLSRTTAHKTRDPLSRPTSAVISDTPVLLPTVVAQPPSNTRFGSPVSSLHSDNWVTYPSRNSSPINENIARQASLVSSGTVTPPSLYSGMTDWIASPQRTGRDDGSASKENSRGKYTSLNDHEYYGNEDEIYDDHYQEQLSNDIEQDLGERSIHVYGDSDDHLLTVNPLGMNPPTPRPKEEETEVSHNSKGSLLRLALADIPNPSVNNGDGATSLDVATSGRFYGDLQTKTGFSAPRAVSKMDETSSASQKKKFGSRKLWGRKAEKISTYESLKVDDDSDSFEDVDSSLKQRSKPDSDSDRKGRVVSNSGIDLGVGFQPGQGSPSYGNYIAGLGVGRRRDVSGKVAEEGRGGTPQEQTPEKPASNERPGQSRAAGWARFAGL